MITSPAFAGKTYAVHGLARSGRATVAALEASGATVLAWDDGAAARDAYAGALTDIGSADLTGVAALVTSPGVPLDAPIVRRAKAANLPVIGDIELFALARPGLPKHTVAGITGTNGKSTVTALLHHLLVTAGRAAQMGGNFGLPILEQQPLPEGGTYVLELSSFQLDLTFSLVSDVAVLTNITPDHLDRHGTMSAYAAAKARLFEMQVPADTAIIGMDDEYSLDIANIAVAHLTPISARTLLDEGVSVVDGIARVDGNKIGRQADWPTLQGPHNAQNAAAAIAAATALGLDAAAIARGLPSYPGLPHRMERIAEKSGVLWVNDSKATNADSTAPALRAYPRIHWIAGGRAKSEDLDALLPGLGNVSAAYVIGEAAQLFGEILDGHVRVVQAGTLAAAVAAAADAAQPGDTVLLSPACASFDQFRDYVARGEAFRAAVEALP